MTSDTPSIDSLPHPRRRAGLSVDALPAPLPFDAADPPEASLDALQDRGWESLLIALALFLSAVAVIFRVSAVDIELSIDGRMERIRSRSGTVGAMLIEHRVDVSSGDLVMPAVDRRLRSGIRITIQRARPVRLHVDGRVIELRSHARSALAVLKEAGIALGPRDSITVNDRPWPVDLPVASLVANEPPRLSRRPSLVRVAEAAGLQQVEAGLPELELASDSDDRLPGDALSWELEVWRAMPVSLIEDGVPIELTIAGPTIVDALNAAGFQVLAEDEVFPAPELRPQSGMQIRLRRATPFTVVTGDETLDLRARADSIGEALRSVGLDLVGRDYSIPAAERPLTPLLTVAVVRVLEDVLVQELPIAYATITEADAAMLLDETRVVRAGETGLKTQRIKITYENGVEIDRQLEEEIILREPLPEILAYGTQIVWHTVNTEVGPQRYWRHLRVYATSYSASRAGTPTWVPWYGMTRLGWPMRHGIVAVDPRFIPLRTELYVPGYGRGVAGDTGGGIKRYHIDLGFDDDNYQSWHQWVDVYLLEPLPPADDIPWILP